MSELRKQVTKVFESCVFFYLLPTSKTSYKIYKINIKGPLRRGLDLLVQNLENDPNIYCIRTS